MRAQWTSLRQVLLSPSVGFYRLAESGGWVAPVVLTTLVGLFSGGMDSLKTVVLAIIMGEPSLSRAYAGKAAASFIVLAPVYYAGMTAVFALVGLAGDRVEGADGEDVVVPERFIYVRPGNPAATAVLPSDWGPLVPVERVMGRVMSAGFLPSTSGRGEDGD